MRGTATSKDSKKTTVIKGFYMSARNYDLNGKKKQGNITLVEDGEICEVRLHGHQVVRWNKLGDFVQFSHCGYITATTQATISRFLKIMGLRDLICKRVKGVMYLVNIITKERIELNNDDLNEANNAVIIPTYYFGNQYEREQYYLNAGLNALKEYA